MQNAKLIELLKRYPLRRLNKFAEFVHSPYFNKRPLLAKLLDYLLRTAPDFEDKYRLHKDTIFRYLFPDKDQTDIASLHRWFSELLQLFYDFLALQHWQQRPIERDLWVLRELRRSKMDTHYEHLAKETVTRFQNQNNLAVAERFYYQFRLHKELDAQFIDQGGRQYDPNLQQANDNLDAFLICEKLRMACDMASRNLVVKADYRCTLLDVGIEAQLPQTLVVDTPIVKIYQTILRMRTADTEIEEEQAYEVLNHLLATHHPDFTLLEQTDMYGYALNHAIQQINKGKHQYHRAALEHYKTMVERRLIFVDDFLPAWDYKNIITIALRLEEYEWTAHFIEAYRRFLPSDIQDNAYRYNLASYYHAIGKCGEALQALHNVEFTDASYLFGAKIIQLKSYYYLNEGEPLRSLVSAFGALLRRHKNLSDYWKQATLNCVKITQRMYNIKEKMNFSSSKKWKNELHKLAETIQQTSPLANKPWLEQCLEELQGLR